MGKYNSVPRSRRVGILKTCAQCGNKFWTTPKKLARRNLRHCSLRCRRLSEQERDHIKYAGSWNRIVRHYGYKNRYGISLEDYEKMLELQGFKCLGCSTIDRTGESFVIDHSHTTGSIRGILCRKCNLAIGYANDNPEILECLADYLRDGG